MLVARIPLKRMMGVPTSKLAPVIVTLVPTGPAPGKKPRIVGWTTKLLAVVEEPAGVLIRIGPVLAPTGVVTISDELFVGDPNEAETSLKKTTLVVPRKLVPFRVTLVPARPIRGAKPVMVGAIKKLELTKVPWGERTLIGPLTTPAGG